MTMVAAWIRADTGVGPAMASASQVISGSCADLPQAPSSRSRLRAITTPGEIEAAWALISLMLRVPVAANSQSRAMARKTSPTRVTRKALVPALAFSSLRYQKPIRP